MAALRAVSHIVLLMAFLIERASAWNFVQHKSVVAEAGAVGKVADTVVVAVGKVVDTVVVVEVVDTLVEVEAVGKVADIVAEAGVEAVPDTAPAVGVGAGVWGSPTRKTPPHLPPPMPSTYLLGSEADFEARIEPDSVVLLVAGSEAGFAVDLLGCRNWGRTLPRLSLGFRNLDNNSWFKYYC